MRGRGGNPNRVVDYNRFANKFASPPGQQPPPAMQTVTNPINAAPVSPRVGINTGDVGASSGDPGPPGVTTSRAMGSIVMSPEQASAAIPVQGDLPPKVPGLEPED